MVTFASCIVYHDKKISLFLFSAMWGTKGRKLTELHHGVRSESCLQGAGFLLLLRSPLRGRLSLGHAQVCRARGGPRAVVLQAVTARAGEPIDLLPT